MERASVRFGILDDFTPNLGRIRTYSIHRFQNEQYIATTSRAIYRFNHKEIIKTYPFKCLASVIIPDIDVLIVFKQNSSILFGFEIFAPDPKRLVLPETDIKQSIVYHLIYSPKSHYLIAIGFGIKVFKLNSTKWSNTRTSTPPEMSITFKSSFAANIHVSVKNPPIFDYENECLILPTSHGLCPFDMDGNKLEPIALFPCKPLTNNFNDSTILARLSVFTMIKRKSRKKNLDGSDRYKVKIATSDPENGLCIWRNNAQLERRILTSDYAIQSIFFVDFQNILYLDSNGTISLCNILTGRSFPCYITQKIPAHLALFKNNDSVKLAISYELELIILSINVPWTTFALNLPAAPIIRRCFRLFYPSRIMINSSNSFINLYSPKDTKLVSALSPNSLSLPVYSFYDRGMILDYHYIASEKNHELQIIELSDISDIDQLFVILEDGTLIIFQSGEQVFEKKINATSISYANYKDEWCLCLSSKSNELVLIDYFTFEQKVRFFPSKLGTILNFFYHLHTNLLIILYEDQILSFDVNRGSICCKKPIKGSTVSALFDDTLYIGYKTGQILWVNIDNTGNLILPSSDDVTYPHSMEVTNFGFSFNVWISCSLDHSINIWDYQNTVITTIYLPTPIYSCEFISGKLDLLVGTDREIMFIPGEKICESKYFESDFEELDNFNELNEDECNNSSFINTYKSMKSMRSLRNIQLDSSESKQKEEEIIEKKKSATKIVYDDATRATIISEMLSLTNAASTTIINDIIGEKDETKGQSNENEQSNNLVMISPSHKKQKKVKSIDEIINKGEEAEKKIEKINKRKQKKKNTPKKKPVERIVEEEENLEIDNIFGQEEEEKLVRRPKKNYKIEIKPVKRIDESEPPKTSKTSKSKSKTKKTKKMSSLYAAVPPQAESGKISIARGKTSSFIRQDTMTRSQSMRRMNDVPVTTRRHSTKVPHYAQSISNLHALDKINSAASSRVNSRMNTASNSRMNSAANSRMSSAANSRLSSRVSTTKATKSRSLMNSVVNSRENSSSSDSNSKLSIYNMSTDSSAFEFTSDEMSQERSSTTDSILLSPRTQKLRKFSSTADLQLQIPMSLYKNNTQDVFEIESPLSILDPYYENISMSQVAEPQAVRSRAPRRLTYSIFSPTEQKSVFQDLTTIDEAVQNDLIIERKSIIIEEKEKPKEEKENKIPKENEEKPKEEKIVIETKVVKTPPPKKAPKSPRPELKKVKKTNSDLSSVDPALSYMFRINNIKIKNRSISPPPKRKISKTRLPNYVSYSRLNGSISESVVEYFDVQPNIVLDEECLMREYGRGWTQLQKLIEYLQKMEELDKRQQNFDDSEFPFKGLSTQSAWRHRYPGYIPYWAYFAMNHRLSKKSSMKKKKFENSVKSALLYDAPLFRIDSTLRALAKTDIVGKLNSELSVVTIDSRILEKSSPRKKARSQRTQLSYMRK